MSFEPRPVREQLEMVALICASLIFVIVFIVGLVAIGTWL